MKSQLSILFGSLILCSAMLSSCASSGIYASANITNVELARANYKIVANSISGESKAKYLLGISFGLGMYTQAFALIPLSKNRALYKLAIENLWKNFEVKYGSPQGRRLALINVRYDSESLNLFFYTSPKLILVADVIEFTE